jgi:myo-inositol 2-dehydrogenase/D-chiro-inositol 1-dehydrogenase
VIRFGLFGAGFIGAVHGGNIVANPRSALTRVYDPDHQAAVRLADRLGAQVATSPDEIFSDAGIDAVLVASSTNTHADLLSRAIAAGKPTFCEKPIDLDMERVKAVVSAGLRSGVPVFLGFSRRFDPNHRALREAVVRGDVGRIELMHLTSRGPRPPPISYVKVSGGQFRDQTIHFFDLARWIAGEDPVEVYAAGAALVDPAIGEAGDVDTSMLVLRFAGGALCHLDQSRRSAYGYDERIEVFGSKGMVQSERKRTREVSLYTGEKIVLDGLHPGWFERLEPSFALALEAFLVSVEQGTPPSPSLLDGLRAQQMAEAAVESLRSNRPVPITYWQPQGGRGDG